MISRARKRKLIVAGLAEAAILSLIACSFIACKGTARMAGQDRSATAAVKTTRTPPAEFIAPLLQKESKFDHNRREHKSPLCNQCHSREERDPVNPIPKRPYHDACAKCHARENFLEASSNSLLCVSCHGKGTIMSAQESATLTDFPKALNQFGLKRFSHQTHLDPSKMASETPSPKCDVCHRFDDRMIAASFPRHQECYSCHVHSAGQKLSDCDACHAGAALAMKFDKGLGDATRQYNFKHGAHLRQASIRSNCVVCHNITERPSGQSNGAARSDVARGAVSRGQRHQSACW